MRAAIALRWLYKIAADSLGREQGHGTANGDEKEDYPAGLLEHKQIIDSSDELRTWLGEHR